MDSVKIKKLRDASMEKYRYSDCDGDNNHGIRLNEEMFAKLIIERCISVIDDQIIQCDDDGWDEGVRHTAMLDSIDIIKKEFGMLI